MNSVKGLLRSRDDTAKSRDDTAKSRDDTAKSRDDTAKSRDKMSQFHVTQARLCCMFFT